MAPLEIASQDAVYSRRGDSTVTLQQREQDNVSFNHQRDGEASPDGSESGQIDGGNGSNNEGQDHGNGQGDNGNGNAGAQKGGDGLKAARPERTGDVKAGNAAASASAGPPDPNQPAGVAVSVGFSPTSSPPLPTEPPASSITQTIVLSDSTIVTVSMETTPPTSGPESTVFVPSSTSTPSPTTEPAAPKPTPKSSSQMTSSSHTHKTATSASSIAAPSLSSTTGSDASLITSISSASAAPVTALAATTATTTTAINFRTGFGDAGNIANDDSSTSGNAGGQRGLGPAGTHALIALGSIGAFILLCSLVFLGWRVFRTLRPNDSSHPADTNKFVKLTDRLLGKVPALRRRSTWLSIDERPQRQVTPEFGEKAMPPRTFFNVERIIPYMPDTPAEPASKVNERTLDRFAALNATRRSASPSQSTNWPLPQPPPLCQPTQDPSRLSESFSSSSNPYEDPAMRTLYRVSEASSLSSGFGDGDIIVVPQPLHMHPPSLPAGATPQQGGRQVSTIGLARTLSSSNHQSAEDGQRQSSRRSRMMSWRNSRQSLFLRDGASRPISAVSPISEEGEGEQARFRSVNSWVTHQTGR